jgi:AcrR family transcriptional regulator
VALQAFDLAAKKQPRQARAKATSAALLDATARILERGGYAVLTTNRVAEVAGVSIGSVYEYFPNKQALLAALAAREMSGILDEVARGMGTLLKNPNQQEAYRNWFGVMLDAVEKRRHVLRVVRHEAPFLADIPESKQLNRALLEIATLGRQQAEREGTAPSPFRDPEASMFLITTMVGAVIERVGFDSPKHLSRERILDTLAEMVLKLL